MSLPLSIRDQATDDGFFPAPYSLDPLPHELRLGLIAPGVCGILSALSTLALITFILQRLMLWRRHYRTFIGYNQYVMLVLNLLIADLQQACAFLISWYWIARSQIVAPTAACFAQGWLLHSGDVSSALFVLAIAVHTFCTAVLGWRIKNTAFYGFIAGLWVAAYVLTGIGVGLHPNDYFVRAGGWCWISAKYENERLYLHYLWIFLVEFTTIVLYAITFFGLRCKTRKIYRLRERSPSQPNPKTIQAVNRVTRLMMLYPCVYIMLTLPLSSGRMWSMAHQGAATSDAFSCTAGALLASCGWVDVLLYTLTRRRLLNDTMPVRSGRNNSAQDNIMSTKTVVVHDHGPHPALVDRRLDLPPPGFLDEHKQHLDLGERPTSDRVSGCLLDTPPSRSGSNDPITTAAVRSDLGPDQYDWRDIIRGRPPVDFEIETTQPVRGGEKSNSKKRLLAIFGR